MASDELCGRTPEQLEGFREEYYESDFYKEYHVAFEKRYCLAEIRQQPDWYDGEQRYCCLTPTKVDDYDGHKYDPAAYGHACRFHSGGMNGKRGKGGENGFDEKAGIRSITHGTYATDEHLKMDFDEEEQELYDSILQDWPEIYDWPAESEDPARYRILRRVAVNEVRGLRQEDYLDDHEVHVKEIPTENGVQEEEVENPLAREYRLLMSEVTNQLRELGLTPKEQQKMDTLESQAEKDDTISNIGQDALDRDDGDYDADQFS
jgi:hypothetical protein